MTYRLQPYLLLLGFVFASCRTTVTEEGAAEAPPTIGTYAYDAEFLRSNTNQFVELSRSEGMVKVALSADFQGRVMTSTASGDTGKSFGWINYPLIKSGDFNPQFNPVGGEERFWLGPEGGQYSLYFKQGDPFDIENWKVPAIIDTVTFGLEKATDTSAVFSKHASLSNYSGTSFEIEIERSVVLLSKAGLEDELGLIIPPAVNVVAYETVNEIKNSGQEKWTKETGLVSIWLLGMFTPSPETVVIIPFKRSDAARDFLTDDYFGEIPGDRLMIKDSVILFTCDGQYRSKIGLAPEIAKPLAASFDFRNNVLTIIKFPVDEEGSYVNSKWEIQEQPYEGDVVNSYNDGPLEDGTQLGPFYELESSSSAKELAPGEIQQYRQLTSHFEGQLEDLAPLAREILGVNLQEIKNNK